MNAPDSNRSDVNVYDDTTATDLLGRLTHSRWDIATVQQIFSTLDLDPDVTNFLYRALEQTRQVLIDAAAESRLKKPCECREVVLVK